ncbi:uncharacterized protein LOC126787315 [Argentina anserina]|uniref:uncharacterized protein LOC126787315 n=1 Tax=Argentina anserina TaxID=57926 RepID=UPI0021763300|nr:uncharacterized protein LOC126787315 [Potentilla anserina]
MWPKYVHSCWKWHGEALPMTNVGDPHVGGADITAVLHDAFGMHGPNNDDNFVEEDAAPQNFTPDVANFYRLIEEGKVELYQGCGKSKLDFILQLYQLKSQNCWTDVSFTALLNMLQEWFPEASLPSSFYQTRKMVTDLALPCEKIDAKLGHPGVPHKVLRYFPLGPRLQRLYMSRHTAQNMVWHSEERTDDDILRHPADSPAWKHLDKMYPSVATEPRNVRLGLASDGFNPFGTMSLSHSTWPIVISVYNFPPWLCLKQPYLMLSLLIHGPKSPRNDIDVFLQPLVEELQTLWSQGIPTYDAFKKESFNLHAAVLWTINDFRSYAMLSGWSTKGSECLDSLKGLKFVYGKGDKYKAKRLKRKRGKMKRIYSGPWKKKSIFFDLPYWKDLLLRHCLDVMHIEKNVAEAILGTLLGMVGKDKDSLNARLDLQELKCKPKYHPKLVGS